MKKTFAVAGLILIGLLPGFAEKTGISLPLFFFRNTDSGSSFIVETPEMRAAFSSDSVCFEAHGVPTVLRFSGANKTVRIEGEEAMAGRVNVFSGARTRTGLQTYGRIRYRELYPGIDLTYSGMGRGMKAEFLVAAGADPTAIRLAYDGEVSIGATGELIVRNKGAELREEAPVVSQDGKRVSGRYRLLDAHTAGFAFGDYDHARALIIDPTISYSTYLGGTGSGAVNGLAVDSTGNLYIAGWTEAMNFPIEGAYQASNQGSVNAVVAKFNAAGTSLLYATYIGGNSDDRAWGIAVDSSGNAYVTGSTTSTNFPLVSSLRSSLGGGRDAFVLKLNSTGNALAYSTLLGGSNEDWGYAIAVDSSGDAYVAGDTMSTDFPVTKGALQITQSGQTDVFVTKLTTAGAMVFSTYLGGSAVEHAGGIAIDASLDVYVAGGTLSTNFPTLTPIQPANGGGQDAFVAKINSTGAALLYSTYLGGSGGSAGAPEQANAIAVDGSGNAYIAGVTPSTNFPVTSGALQPANNGGADAFVAEIATSGTVLVYSTYLGGSLFDQANAIAVDSSGNTYVAGYTSSPDFTTANDVQAVFGGLYDAFVTELGPSGTSLVFSTYYGGAGSDEANAIALDSSADIFVGGETNSSNFPLEFAYQTANSGGPIGWVARLGVPPGSPTPDLIVAKSHTGDFTQGQTGAIYTITASNSGTGPTSGTVTVTESLPVGMTATSMAGGGWTCTQPVGPCTRSDALPAGSSYPPLTLTVNVSDSAPASVTNMVSVSGGGETNTGNDQASDLTTITAVASSGTASSIFSSSAVPQNPLYVASAVTLGVKFQSSVSGSITGMRFYKGAGNNGTHIGLLYSSGGTVLAQATFTSETASGWQQVDLPTPVAIAANTVYVAAYFTTSGFAYNASYFTSSGVSNPPLQALQYGADGPNGVYMFGSAPQFPTSDGLSENYWADVVFSTTSGPSAPDLIVAKSHTGSFTQGQTGATYTITASNGGTGPTSGTVTVTESLPVGLTATSIAGAGWTCAHQVGPCTRSDALPAGSSYPALTLTVNVSDSAPASVTNTVTVSGGGETNTGNDQASDLTTITAVVSTETASSIFSSSAVPQNPLYVASPVTLGVKFQSSVSGSITGIRFYKGAGNNGTHIGLLYSSSGTVLAQAGFTGETASGWQQVSLSTPVAITANTVYVAAYFTTSGFAYNASYFTSSGVSNPPLQALQYGVDGSNGVYMFGSAPQFPTSDGLSENYWVDVVFSTASVSTAGPVTSIFSSSAVPQNPLYVASPVTLGVKFQSSVSGSITGIRFYKGAGNNGTHIGLLFSSGGTVLAQATFTGETASGWQQVNLPSPVAIAANTMYVAAYFTTSGFAYNASYFTNSGVSNPPLEALQYGTDGPNGVYIFGSAPQFPTSDGLSENYWADVVFSPASSSQ